MTAVQVVEVDLMTQKTHMTQTPPKAASLVHVTKMDDSKLAPIEVVVIPATEDATTSVDVPATPAAAPTTIEAAKPEPRLPPCPIALLRATHLLALQSTIVRLKKERADYRIGWSVYRNYTDMIDALEYEAEGVRRAQQDLDRFPSVFTPIVANEMSGPKTQAQCEADDVKRLAALHLWARPVKFGPLTKQQARAYDQARKMLKQIPMGIEDSWTFMYEMEMRRHMDMPGKPPFGAPPKKPRMIGPMNLDQALRHQPLLRDLPYGPITKEVALLLAKMLPKKLEVAIPPRLVLLKFPPPETEPLIAPKQPSARTRKHSGDKSQRSQARVGNQQSHVPISERSNASSSSSEAVVDFLKELQASPPDRLALPLPPCLPSKPAAVEDDHTDNGLSWLQAPYSAYPSAIGKELRAIRHADGLSWMKMPYREFGREAEANLRKVRRKMERVNIAKAVV